MVAPCLFLAPAAIGVLIGDCGRYWVADHWAAVSATYAPIAFQTVLDSTDAVAHALEHAVSGDYDYRTLPGDVRLALAREVTFDPTSPQPPAILETLLRDHAPEAHSCLADGGRYLELGCGVGRMLWSLMRTYPLMTAVGVELSGMYHPLGSNHSKTRTFWVEPAQWMFLPIVRSNRYRSRSACNECGQPARHRRGGLPHEAESLRRKA